MASRYLPELDETRQPPTPSGGTDWGDHGAGLAVLEKYSAALVVKHVDVPVARLKSVPSPWARLLLFEQALFSPRHPVHAKVVDEWRGLMGAIALGPYLGLDVEAKPVDIAKGGKAITDLRAMLPTDDQLAVWDRLALIYIDGELVGGSSPRTLVYTGIRPIAGGRIPFQHDCRLTDPTEHYKANGDRSLLAILRDWIQETQHQFKRDQSAMTRLLGYRRGGDGTAPLPRLESLLREIERWGEETRLAAAAVGALPDSVVTRYEPSRLTTAFPSNHPGSAVYALLTQPVPIESVGLINDLQVADGEGVVDPGVDGVLFKNGNPYSGTVILPRGQTRAVRNGRFVLPSTAADLGATLPAFGSYFASKLVQIVGAASEGVRALVVGTATYLLPVKPELLDFAGVKPEQLADWVKATGTTANGITVRIEVPLQSGLTLVDERRYSSADILGRDRVTTPFLSIWPDFESTEWKEYHYFIRQPQAGSKTLSFHPWPVSAPLTEGDEPTGRQWGRLEEPARVWVGRYDTTSGLLVTPPLGRRVPATGSEWEISVDFGSTHTRVFRAKVGLGGAIQSEEVPFTPRVRSLLGDEPELAFTFFPRDVAGLAAEPPSLVWLPLERTTAPGPRKAWLPIDGVMFWKPVQDAPNQNGLRGDLKWHRPSSHDRQAFKSYVSHLLLSVAAEAAAVGARVRSLVTAYPSVLPSTLRHRHVQEWRDLGRGLGISVLDPRSESAAVASYFAGARGASIATNLLAADIGGSTTDIAVWLRNQQAHSDSIRLAGDILSRLLVIDQASRDALSDALSLAPFNLAAIRWAPAGDTANGLIFNSILRTISRHPDFLNDRALLAKNLNTGSGSTGERVVAHVAYLFATVSYLLGLMLRHLDSSADRYDLRFAGKGSEFLHWLEALGKGASISLPQHFFRAGLGASPPSIDVHVPDIYAKQEVGRGLLLSAMGQQRVTDERSTFLGETGYRTASGPLEVAVTLDAEMLRALQEPERPVPLRELESLNAFVQAFESDPVARKVGRALGLSPATLDEKLRDTIHTRLFGPHSAFAATQNGTKQDQGDTLFEPFFVTEAKVLLEHATHNSNLFAG